jgi:hypothetical protein
MWCQFTNFQIEAGDILMKKSALPFLLLLALVAASLQVVPAARAQEGATVRLVPVAQNDDTFTLDVVAENVTDLYGLEFFLTYDPSVLAVVDANPEQEGIQVDAGTLLPAQSGFVVSNQADPVAGRVSYAMTLLNPAPPVSGSGSLAQVTFQQLQDAAATVDIADVKLVSFELQIIPVETEGVTFDGTTLVVAANPAPGSDFPWWIAGVGVIIIGLIALGLFLFLDSARKKSDPSQPVGAVSNRPARGRPSAFK